MMDCLDPVQINFINNTFNLDICPKKEKKMNDNISTALDSAITDELAQGTPVIAVPGEGETTPAETTVAIAEDHPDHVA
jgi:hypothetical protein